MVRVRQTRRRGQSSSTESTSQGSRSTQPFSEMVADSMKKHGLNFNTLFNKESQNANNSDTKPNQINNVVEVSNWSHFLGQLCTKSFDQQTQKCHEILDKLLWYEWDSLFQQLFASGYDCKNLQGLMKYWITKCQDGNILVNSSFLFNVIQAAIYKKCVSFLQIYFSMGGEFALIKQITKKSFLHVAVECEDIHVLETLCSFKKISLDVQDVNGKTALHYAVKLNALDMVRILLREGASFNLADNQHFFPWMYALDQNLIKMYVYLRTKLLEECFSCVEKEKLVATVCKSGSVKAFKCLLDIDESILNMQNSETLNTPLLEAMLSSNFELAKMLLDHNCDINILNKEGKSALLCMLDLEFYDQNIREMCDLLLSKGAMVNQLYKDGKTALIKFFNQPYKFKWLLSNGANPNLLAPSGLNVLWCLCHNAKWKEDGLRYLMAEGSFDPELINIKVSINESAPTGPIEECLCNDNVEMAYNLYYMSVSYKNLPFSFSSSFLHNQQRKQVTKVVKLIARIQQNQCRIMSLKRLSRNRIVSTVLKSRHGKTADFGILPLPPSLLNYVDPNIFRKTQEQLDDEMDLDSILDTPYYRDPYLDDFNENEEQ